MYIIYLKQKGWLKIQNKYKKTRKNKRCTDVR